MSTAQKPAHDDISSLPASSLREKEAAELRKPEAAPVPVRRETASEAFLDEALTLLDSEAVAELHRLQQETCAHHAPSLLESS